MPTEVSVTVGDVSVCVSTSGRVSPELVDHLRTTVTLLVTDIVATRSTSVISSE